jgi:hypothetical protein
MHQLGNHFSYSLLQTQGGIELRCLIVRMRLSEFVQTPLVCLGWIEGSLGLAVS